MLAIVPVLPRRGCALAVLVAATLSPAPLIAQEKEEVDPTVRGFEERAAEKGADREKLRQEVLAFARRNPGTPAAVQAARLLGRLPSPLDNLDPRSIPELERFEGQPKELVAVLGEHRGRQGQVAAAVAYGQKGKRIASAGHDGYVRVWDPATLRQQARFSTGTAAICVALSPDERLVAAGNTHGGLYVYDVSGKAPVLAGTFPIATSAVYSVDFSPDGKSLAASAYDGQIHLFDTSGDKVKVREPSQLAGHKTPVRAVRFSPSGKTLVSGSTDGTIRFWTMNKDSVSEGVKLEGHPKGVTALAWSPTGTMLAAGAGDGSVWFWAVGNRVTRGGAPFPAHKAEVSCLTYSPSGRSLFTCSPDGTAGVWNAATRRLRYAVEGHQGIVHGGDFAPDSRTLVTGGADWTVRLWDLAGARPVEKFPLRGHWSVAHGARFAPDGRSLATGSEDHTLRAWDLTGAAPDQVAQLPFGERIYAVAYAPDGKTIATAGHSTQATLWDSARRVKLRSLAGAPTIIYQIAYTPDGKRVLASSGKELLVWDAASGREVTRFTAHKERIGSFSVSGDGRYALTGTGFYEYKDGKIVTKDNLPQYLDCTLRLFDLQSGALVKEETKLKYPVYSVAFAPAGRQAVCSLWQSNTRLWDVSPEQLKDKGELKTGVTYAHRHVFAPDGRRLATVGNEYRLVVYDLQKGSVIWQWAPPEYINGTDFSPDGRYLAVALRTGPVYVLRLTDAPSQQTSR